MKLLLPLFVLVLSAAAVDTVTLPATSKSSVVEPINSTAHDTDKGGWKPKGGGGSSSEGSSLRESVLLLGLLGGALIL